jgi:predicted TIM-barrel fold metal-dependent hydrolase
MEMYRFEWLAQHTEEAVDPDRVIVDPHHHLWSNRGGVYLADDLIADTRGSHNVVKTVFVECRSKYDRDAAEHLQPVGETMFVAEQAAAASAGGDDGRSVEIGAIVSFANMLLGEAVEEVLAAHDGAGNGLFRGIRHAVTHDPDPEVPGSHSGSTEGMMDTPEFHAGVATLGRMGFSFDSWMYHPQLPQLTRLARANPDTTIILDHLGGPVGIGSYADRRDEAMADWRASMTELATCDNVNVKVGGIGMDNYYGTGWSDRPTPPTSDDVVAHWADRVHFCIDTFGPGRCMMESNFPVDRQTLSYPVLWNGLQKMAARYSDAEQDLLFSGTATRVYGLDR